MLNRPLIAVVSAMNTIESIGYLFTAARGKVVKGLIDKLLPHAEADFVPACRFIVEHTADPDQRDYFKRKLAALVEEPVLDHRTVFLARTQEQMDYLMAVNTNNLNAVRQYLEEGGNPFFHLQAETPLYLAVKLFHYTNDIRMLQLLIQTYQRYDFCLNHSLDSVCHSAVGMAAKLGLVPVLELFFNAGIEPEFVHWEWYYYFKNFTKHPYQAILDKYLNAKISTLGLSVLPIIQKNNQPPEIGFEPALEKPEKYVIDSQEKLNLIYRNPLIYDITTYNETRNQDVCVLNLSTRLFKVFGESIFRQLIKEVSERLLAYLNNLDIVFESHIVPNTEVYEVQFHLPRKIFPLIINFLLEMHQQHILAIGTNRLLNELGFLNEATPAVKARVEAMLPLDFPSVRDMPLLLDYDYSVVMRPLALDAIYEFYRNYCVIRFYARMFAQGVSNGSLANQADVWIKIASMVGDYAFHKEKKSLKIARDNFQRMPSNTYTPRLFLPAPVVEVAPVDVPTPQLK